MKRPRARPYRRLSPGIPPLALAPVTLLPLCPPSSRSPGSKQTCISALMLGVQACVTDLTPCRATISGTVRSIGGRGGVAVRRRRCVRAAFCPPSLPNEMVVFFRSFFRAGRAAAAGVASRGQEPLKTRRLGRHLGRRACRRRRDVLLFYAVAQMPARRGGAAVTIRPRCGRSSRVVAARTGTPKLWVAIGTGFSVFCLSSGPDKIVRHRSRLSDLPRECWPRVAMTGVRRLTHTVPVFRIVFYFSLVEHGDSGSAAIRALADARCVAVVAIDRDGVIVSLNTAVAHACICAHRRRRWGRSPTRPGVRCRGRLDAVGRGAGRVFVRRRGAGVLGGASFIRHAGAVAALAPELPGQGKDAVRGASD